MRTGLMVAAVVLAVTGCGGAEEEPEAAPSDPTESAIETRTLAESCSEIEAQLPDVDSSPSDWRTYWSTLGTLAEEGDTETQNAIDVLRPAVDRMASATGGQKLLNAESSLFAALDTMADRCKAVGSSALQ